MTDEGTERIASAEAPTQQEQRRALGGNPMDYWYDLSEDGGTRTVVTYAYGMPIDERSSDTKTWDELLAETVPAIVLDITNYGIA
jgi:hypothetical protein